MARIRVDPEQLRSIAAQFRRIEDELVNQHSHLLTIWSELITSDFDALSKASIESDIVNMLKFFQS